MPAKYPESAQHALSIFKSLRVHDMPGQPAMGDVCRDWVFDFVASVFGGRNPETGEQEIREYFLLIPKKNTKTMIGAGVMLTQCILNERQNDEQLLLSATRETANLAFSAIAGMIRADEDLSALFWVRDNLKTVTHRVTNNSIKIVSLSNDTLAGKRASFVLIDELWLLGTMRKAEGALQEAIGGQVSRPEAWVISLTTQSDEPPQGVFKDKLQYARQVQDGTIEDTSFLPVLYELPKGYDWRNHVEKAFELTNPNLGASVSKSWLMAEYKKVKDKTDGQLQRFLAKHMNVEIGLNLRTDRWAGADFWEKQEQPLTLDEILDRSEVVSVGIDGGGLDDMLGFCVMGRDKDTKRKLAWGHAWINPVVMERRAEIGAELQTFVNDGDLSIADTGEDMRQLAELAAKIVHSGKLDKVGVDPFGLGGVLEALNDAGIPENKIVGISQGWKLGAHIQCAERWLSGGSLVVADQNMMRWCVGNARIEPRSNGIMITKQASGRAKIDPVIALINATAIMAQNPESKNKRVAMFSL